MSLFPGVNAGTARTLSDRSQFGATPFLSPERIAILRQMYADDQNPNSGYSMPTRIRAKWNEMMAATADTINGPPSPWSVPAHYSNPNDDTLTGVNDDIKNMVGLAMRWRILDDAGAAAGAAAFLNAYADIAFLNEYPDRVDDSRLTWGDRWPCFIQAALYIQDNPTYYTQSLKNRLRTTTLRGLRLSEAYNARRMNNWSAWGLVLEFASATFLNDRARFDLAVAEWRSHIDHALKPQLGLNGTKNGVMIPNIPYLEVYRQENRQGDGTFGLHYAQFYTNALTQAAEWARFGGVWLYDYTSTNGSTFYGLWQNVANWLVNPGDYPFNTSGTPLSIVRIAAFVDILHSLWPEVLYTIQSETDSYGYPKLLSERTVTQDYLGFYGSILSYRPRL